MSQTPPAKILLLDLDDTLYAETSYVNSGYAAVARHLASRCGLTAGTLHHFMRYVFFRHGRDGVFDRMLDHFGLAEIDIGELVTVYRGHEPTITFYPGVIDTLRTLRSRYWISVVTDGSPQMQQAKAAALSLMDHVDDVLYCWELGLKKPDPGAFLEAARRYGISPSAALIVGDDPYHDVEAARRGGFPVVRVRTGRLASLDTLAADPATPELSDFTALPDFLDQRVK